MPKTRHRATRAEKVAAGGGVRLSPYALKRGIRTFPPGSRIELELDGAYRTGTVFDVRGPNVIVILDEIGRRFVPLSSLSATTE